jgi:hypothetical protein
VLQVENPGKFKQLQMPQQYYGWLQPKQEEMYRSFVATGTGGRLCDEHIPEPTIFVCGRVCFTARRPAEVVACGSFVLRLLAWQHLRLLLCVCVCVCR